MSRPELELSDPAGILAGWPHIRAAIDRWAAEGIRLEGERVRIDPDSIVLYITLSEIITFAREVRWPPVAPDDPGAAVVRIYLEAGTALLYQTLRAHGLGAEFMEG